jgi:uncharacterized membrane protein
MDGVVVLKALSVFFLSAVKLFFAPGVAVAEGFGLWETIVLTSAGGVVGVSVFYFFGRWVVFKIERLNFFKRKRQVKRKVFSKRNRALVKYRERFGFYGIIILTPAIISIPIGCILAAKFYRERQSTYPLLLISSILWSVALSVFATFVGNSLY